MRPGSWWFEGRCPADVGGPLWAKKLCVPDLQGGRLEQILMLYSGRAVQDIAEIRNPDATEQRAHGTLCIGRFWRIEIGLVLKRLSEGVEEQQVETVVPPGGDAQPAISIPAITTTKYRLPCPSVGSHTSSGHQYRLPSHQPRFFQGNIGSTLKTEWSW